MWGAFSRIATLESPKEYFNGLISNVCLYDEILSEEKIQKFFNEYEIKTRCPNCDSFFLNK